MKRPMVFLFVYLAGGILLGRYLADALYPLILCAGIFCAAALVLCRRWKSWAPLFFLVFFLFGFLHTNMVLQGEGQSPLRHILNPSISQEGKEVTITGLVTEASNTSGQRQKVTIISKSISSEDIYDQAKKKIYAIMPENKALHLWDEVLITTELCKLEKNTVPGEYNEWLYMKTRGYDFKIFPENVMITGNEPVFLFSQLRKLRDSLQTVYDNVFPEAEAGVIKAMTTGDKQYLMPDTKELYRQAGITHILAISGLHVSALAMLLFFVLEKSRMMSRRHSALTVIGFLILFALFTGCSPSTVRAVIMVSVGMAGIVLYRSGDSLNNIAIAGVFILLFQPLYLFDTGFQMSFITVTGILFCLNVLKKYPHMPEWQKGICASITATFFSYPITAYYFHWISLVAVFANIVVIPMMTMLLAMALLTGIVGLIYMPAAVFFGGTVFAILKAVEWISVSLVGLQYSYVCIGQPSLPSMYFWYGAIVVAYCYRPGSWRSRSSLAVAFTLLFVSLLGNKLFFKHNKLAFLDVGQGDSIVLTTYDKQAFVFDSGGWFWAEPGKNTGRLVIQPYLEREGITEIDGLFLSHMDSDHAGGALDLMNNMAVNGLYISDYDFEPSLLYADILVTAKNKNIPVYRVTEGQEAVFSNGISLRCIYPMKQGGYLFGDDNNGSMVIDLKIGQVSILLTGDASIEDEEIFLRDSILEGTDILKVGHHGSRYSTSALFLQEISPSLAIISCGKDNTYGHPHQEMLDRLEEMQIPTLRTDEFGTVTITTNGSGYTVKTMGEKAYYERVKKAD